MEDEQGKNEDNLVGKLTPTLHQESRDDLASTVKTVLPGRDTTSSNSVLHGRGGSHRILTTDTDTVEKEGPSVANNPAVEGGSQAAVSMTRPRVMIMASWIRPQRRPILERCQ